MADKKITALNASTALSTDDLFHVVDDPSGSPTNKKITATNVFNKIPSWIGLAQTAQALSTPGAIDVTSAITNLTSDGTDAVTLADGTQGQIKICVVTTLANSAVAKVTPTSFDGTSIDMNALGESCTLFFTNSKWYLIGHHFGTIVS